MIITDPPVDYRGKFKWCSHLVSDLPGEEGSRELIAFARKIGMRKEWLQKSGAAHEHFDVYGKRRRRALGAGCIEVDRKRMVAVFRAKRAVLRQQQTQATSLGGNECCGKENHENHTMAK